MNNHAATGISGFQFSIAAEAFGILESTTSDVATTNEDRAYDPATGLTSIYGNHCSGEAERTLVFTTLRNANYNAITVGNTVTLAMAVAIAGHTFSSATHVVTNLSEAGAIGKLLKTTMKLVTLPF